MHTETGDKFCGMAHLAVAEPDARRVLSDALRCAFPGCTMPWSAHATAPNGAHYCSLLHWPPEYAKVIQARTAALYGLTSNVQVSKAAFQLAAAGLFEVHPFNLRDAGDTRAIAVFATGLPLTCSAQEAERRFRRELLASCVHGTSVLVCPRAGRV